MVEQTKIGTQTKTWTEPQLTVLTRGRNEESVLTICKMQAVGGAPESVKAFCSEDGQQVCVGACNEWNPS